jgi:hypothetical protein
VEIGLATVQTVSPRCKKDSLRKLATLWLRAQLTYCCATIPNAKLITACCVGSAIRGPTNNMSAKPVRTAHWEFVRATNVPLCSYRCCSVACPNML